MEGWDRVEEIFLDAVERAPEDRPAFLEQACAGDEMLRREVETLLEHHDPEGSLSRCATISSCWRWS